MGWLKHCPLCPNYSPKNEAELFYHVRKKHRGDNRGVVYFLVHTTPKRLGEIFDCIAIR